MFEKPVCNRPDQTTKTDHRNHQSPMSFRAFGDPVRFQKDSRSTRFDRRIDIKIGGRAGPRQGNKSIAGGHLPAVGLQAMDSYVEYRRNRHDSLQ